MTKPCPIHKNAFRTYRSARATNRNLGLGETRGFKDVLREAGLSLHGKEAGNFSYSGAYAAATKLLSQATLPDALYCCNDIVDLAAIDVAREKGMRVGDDVAIVGFDDIPMASWTSYQLTTTRQPIERMIQKVLDVIEDETIRPSDDASVRVLPGKLVLRGSAQTISSQKPAMRLD